MVTQRRRPAGAPAGAHPPPLAHGLGTELVVADWPAVTADEAVAVLARFPAVGELHTLQWHSPRPFSAAVIAATESGAVFLKRHARAVRDAAGLAEEHRFIRHLRAAGLPVAELLTTEAGAGAVETGEWTYEVHRAAPGFDLYRDALSWTPFTGPAHARAAGRALAALHRAAQSYDAPSRSAAMLASGFTILPATDPLAALGRYLAPRPALAKTLAAGRWAAAFARLILPFHAALAPALPRCRPLWTHNDWHASNLLWDQPGPDAEVSAILDFGLSNRACAAFDIATAIERNAIEWLRLPSAAGRDLVDHAAIDALLDGYDAVRPLAAGELEAVRAMLPIVHVEFALSEADYFLSVLGDRARAALAYDGYLLGHAEWFTTDAGRAPLDQLQRRADRVRTIETAGRGG